MFREPGEKNAHIRVASSRESRQVPQCAYDVSIKTRERISFVSRVFSVCLCRAARRRVWHADLTRAATEAFPNWKIVTRCAPRRTRGFRGRLRPPLEGSAGHPPGGSGRAFPRVPTAQAGSNPAPVRISVRAVRGTRRQSRRSSARARQFFTGFVPEVPTASRRIFATRASRDDRRTGASEGNIAGFERAGDAPRSCRTISGC